MNNCPHLSVKCFCGASPNSPDCKGLEQEYCVLLDEACHGEYAQSCWRYQEHRAEIAEVEVARLREELRLAELDAATLAGAVYRLGHGQPSPVDNWAQSLAAHEARLTMKEA